MAMVTRRGDVLINANDLFPNLPALERDFDMMYFLDFCAGLDAAVIHRAMHTFGSFPGASNPVAQALRDEGIIQRWSATEFINSPEQVTDHRRGSELLAMMPKNVGRDEQDTYARAVGSAVSNITDVVIEAEADLPLVSSAHFLPIYLQLPDVVRDERAVRAARGTAAAIYSSADRALREKRQLFDGGCLLPLPAIALEVLERADSIDDIGQVLLERRHAYSRVRDYFAELDETLGSNSASLKEKQLAEERIAEAMRQALGACESAGVPVLSGLRKGVAELFEIEIKVGEHGEPAVAIPIAKLAERLMDLGTSTFWRYRLKPLYSTIDHYMAASPARIAHVIHKHFHHRVGDRERTLGTSYSKRVADLLGAM